MKRIWILPIIALLLGASGLCGCRASEIEREAAAVESKENKQELDTQIVVIGADEEGLRAALSAVESGARSVFLLYLEETALTELFSQAENNEAITLFPATQAKALIMGTDGRIHTLRASRGEETLVIRCEAVIVAVNPIDEAYAPLLSFLSKCEHGNLLVDEQGRCLRNTNLSQNAPTKCGVPLTTTDKNGDEESVLSVVKGLYGVGEALCENFEPPAVEDIAKAAANLE
ncbi:MAG: hypothetical protein ACI4DN_06695 [Lachnospiraceae bacterium]